MKQEALYKDADWMRARYLSDRMSMKEISEVAGCGAETVLQWLRKHQIPARTRSEAQRRRVLRECEHCGAPIQPKPSVVAKGQGRFCSRACVYAHARRLTDAEEAAHVKAREILNTAVTSGRVRRPSACMNCGAAGGVQGHHHDYAKPLDVEWLCVKCHNGRHRAV